MGYDISHAEHVAQQVRKSLRLSDVLVVKPGEKVGLNLEELPRGQTRVSVTHKPRRAAQ